jgi:hypothetical protein
MGWYLDWKNPGPNALSVLYRLLIIDIAGVIYDLDVVLRDELYYFDVILRDEL